MSLSLTPSSSESVQPASERSLSASAGSLRSGFRVLSANGEARMERALTALVEPVEEVVQKELVIDRVGEPPAYARDIVEERDSAGSTWRSTQCRRWPTDDRAP